MNDAPRQRLVISPVSLNEPLAVFLPIAHLKPGRAILITTVGAEQVANLVAAELRRRGIDVHMTSPVSATDALTLQKAIDVVIAAHDTDELFINATPGTKVMSLTASFGAVGAGGTVVYADTGEERIWRYQDKQWLQEPMSVTDLTVETFVRLSGWDARTGTDRRSYPDLARFLGRNAVALDGLLDHLRGARLQWKVNRECTPIWRSALTMAQGLGLVDTWAASGTAVEGRFSSNDAADYLAGGYWLEDYVHCCAIDADFSAIQRNVDVLRQTGEAHTDLDVVFIHRHRLFVVSCKSGRILEHRQPLDQFVEHLGGLLAGAMVVSTKHAGHGVAQSDVIRARGVQVQSALLHDLPTLPERLKAMASTVTRRPRVGAR